MQPRCPSLRYAVLLAIVFLASRPVFANPSLTLSWDASPDTNVVGYYVYYGPASGMFTNRLDAGSNLTISTPILPSGTYYFSATSRDALGIESQFADFVATNVPQPDISPPMLVTTWPKANTIVPYGQKCVNSKLITTAPDVPLSGKATDNVLVADVTVTRITPTSPLLTFSPTLVGPNTTKTWTNVVPLVVGSNTFQIVVTDSSGLKSTLTRSIFLKVTTPLTVVTNGNGSTTPTGVLTFGSARNGAWLQIGRSYSIKATAKTGNWFVNWTDGSGSVLGTNATLKFQMTNSLTLSANFITNAMVAYQLKGSYAGLFSEDTGATTHSAGSISSVNVSSTRAFTGKMFVGGASYSFSGSFDASGNATNTITRTSKPSIELAMQMDFVRGTKVITGTVSCPGEGWASPLRANLAYYSAKNPNPMAARYTMAIPRTVTATSQSPIGYGYGLITNMPTGTAAMTGALADLTSISCNAPIAQNGDWPVFVDLYSHQGLLYGWLNFSSGAPVGQLEWVKPAQPPATNLLSRMYSAGVNNAIEVVGSIYRPSPSAIALPSGSLELAAETESPSTYSITVANNKFTSPSHITGSVTTATGLITLSLPSIVTGGAMRTAYGVVLQSSNAAVGTVKGTNASIYLH